MKTLVKYRALLLMMLLSIVSSCTALKPYQRVFVNDPEMQMGISSDEKFANYVHGIREGSITAESEKAGGGCGCN